MKKPQKDKKIKVIDDDLRLTILGCFRYSLGRRTYMPSHTVNMIKKHSEIFTSQDWQSFIEEIDKCEYLGDDCDIDTWNKLKALANEQLNKSQLPKISS
jgi:hypothetical protein